MNEDLKMAAIVIPSLLIFVFLVGGCLDKDFGRTHEARMLCIEQGGVWVDGTCAWNKPPPPWTIPVLEGGGF